MASDRLPRGRNAIKLTGPPCRAMKSLETVAFEKANLSVKCIMSTRTFCCGPTRKSSLKVRALGNALSQFP